MYLIRTRARLRIDWKWYYSTFWRVNYPSDSRIYFASPWGIFTQFNSRHNTITNSTIINVGRHRITNTWMTKNCFFLYALAFSARFKDQGIASARLADLPNFCGKCLIHSIFWRIFPTKSAFHCKNKIFDERYDHWVKRKVENGSIR